MTLDVGYSPIFENDKNVKTKATLAHLLIDLKANRKALQNPTKIDLILLPVTVWQLNQAFKFVEKCGGGSCQHLFTDDFLMSCFVRYSSALFPTKHF